MSVIGRFGETYPYQITARFTVLVNPAAHDTECVYVWN